MLTVFWEFISQVDEVSLEGVNIKLKLYGESTAG